MPAVEVEANMGNSTKTPEIDTTKDCAWVEIHVAVLKCPCGHETNFPQDSSQSPFFARPEHTCESCGTRWGMPSAADCEELTSSGVQAYQILLRESLRKRSLGLLTLEDEAEIAERLDDIWRPLTDDDQQEVERRWKVYQAPTPLAEVKS